MTFAIVPDWASPLEPLFRLTVQFVAANATAAVSTVPVTTDATRTARGRRLRSVLVVPGAYLPWRFEKTRGVTWAWGNHFPFIAW